MNCVKRIFLKETQKKRGLVVVLTAGPGGPGGPEDPEVPAAPLRPG